MREFFLHRIYPFQAMLSNFGFCGRKALPPPKMRDFFYTGSIHFRQFWATLVFVAGKPPPNEGNFLHWIYPFQAILSTFGYCGRKAPLQDEGIFFTLDLSISGNFKQLWFLWQKSPPPPMREIFLHWIYPFQVISSNFGFLWQKSATPRWGKFFLHWIYPFQVISSNFGFCGRKAPLPRWGKFFYHGSIHFRQFWATLVFVAEKTPSQDEGKLFTMDLSISGNFKQL